MGDVTHGLTGIVLDNEAISLGITREELLARVAGAQHIPTRSATPTRAVRTPEPQYVRASPPEPFPIAAVSLSDLIERRKAGGAS